MIMWKNMVQQDRPWQYNNAHALFMLDNEGYIHTLIIRDASRFQRKNVHENAPQFYVYTNTSSLFCSVLQFIVNFCLSVWNISSIPFYKTKINIKVTQFLYSLSTRRIQIILELVPTSLEKCTCNPTNKYYHYQKYIWRLKMLMSYKPFWKKKKKKINANK
jgi:hypothetical protein